MAAIDFSSSKRKYKVAVEGNIGCGKSTFLKYFQSISPNIEILSEPIEQWRDAKGYDLFVSSLIPRVHNDGTFRNSFTPTNESGIRRFRLKL